MRTVGLKSLKNKLSEYVRLAAAGETIIITDRDRPVAEIGPPRSPPETWQERGIREGWLTPAKRPFAARPPRQPIPGYTPGEVSADADRQRGCRGWATT